MFKKPHCPIIAIEEHYWDAQLAKTYTGFEAGRPHARYDWRDPRGDAYGYMQVGDYYQDRGRRCATYTQEIWVHGRPETATGRACRQGDGTWQMIS